MCTALSLDALSVYEVCLPYTHVVTCEISIGFHYNPSYQWIEFNNFRKGPHNEHSYEVLSNLTQWFWRCILKKLLTSFIWLPRQPGKLPWQTNETYFQTIWVCFSNFGRTENELSYEVLSIWLCGLGEDTSWRNCWQWRQTDDRKTTYAARSQ